MTSRTFLASLFLSSSHLAVSIRINSPAQARTLPRQSQGVDRASSTPTSLPTPGASNYNGATKLSNAQLTPSDRCHLAAPRPLPGKGPESAAATRPGHPRPPEDRDRPPGTRGLGPAGRPRGCYCCRSLCRAGAGGAARGFGTVPRGRPAVHRRWLLRTRVRSLRVIPAARTQRVKAMFEACLSGSGKHDRWGTAVDGRRTLLCLGSPATTCAKIPR